MVVLTALITLIAICSVLFLLLRLHVRKQLSQLTKPSLSFIHPYPLAGGGGELVLWVAVLAAHSRLPEFDILIYGNFKGFDVDTISRHIEQQFGIKLNDDHFVPVDIGEATVDFVRASRYPRLTLLLQALGAVYLGAVAFLRRPARVVIETGNFTFALIVPYLLGARTIAYVHYPIVSADMLALVRERAPAFNNDARIAKSAILSTLKGFYYHAFAVMYAVAALCVNQPIANSSWTRAHLEAIWRCRRLTTIFPPCAQLSKAGPNETNDRDADLVISVGQFRPEKRHEDQLNAFATLAERYPTVKLRLVMVGGTRGPADEARALSLAREAKSRNLPVEVRSNVSHEELTSLLRRASIGLHTMRDEHFGISVVNMQANGLITVAHKSGGVAVDIIDDGKTGFLASDGANDFAYCLSRANEVLDSEKVNSMRAQSMNNAARFSKAAFQQKFGDVIVEVCCGD